MQFIRCVYIVQGLWGLNSCIPLCSRYLRRHPTTLRAYGEGRCMTIEITTTEETGAPRMVKPLSCHWARVFDTMPLFCRYE